MGKYKVWRIGVLCVFLFSGIVWAQVTTGTISGTAKDSSGAVLPGIEVTVLNEDTGISRTVLTDENGHYSALSLSLGKYRVTGSLQGFQTAVRSGIVLTVGREAVVDLLLMVGAVTDKLEVTGDAPLVETTTASLSSLVDDRMIRALPLNGRSWDQLALIQPGIVIASPGPVNPSNPFSFGTGKRFSVGGQRQNANLFLMDGTDVNDQANGTPGGASGTNLGMDTIQEFKIFTSSYKAEYGHSMGSVITAVTRSGTNNLHGTAFEYIRNSALDTRKFFDVGSSPPPFKRNQFGGVLGGPIKQNKVFFFLGYEAFRQGLGTTQIATVPTALARQGILPTGTVPVNPAIVPYVNLYPLPNGRDFGDGSAQFLYAPTIVTNQDNGMARMDYQLNDKNSIFVRYMVDTDRINAPQVLPNEVINASSRRQYTTLQWNNILSDSTLNHFHFAYNRTANRSEFQYTPDPLINLSFLPGQPLGAIQLGSTGTTSSRPLTPLGPTQGNGPTVGSFNIFEWDDDLSHVVGRHSLKAGVNIQEVQENSESIGGSLGAYTFSSFTDFLRAIPSNFQISLGTPRSRSLRQILFATYFQDEFKVNSRLTLDLGLRWEAPTNPSQAEGKALRLPSPAATSMVVSDTFMSIKKNNFEPRVGLAWQLTDGGKTVLRAGGGIYHNQLLPFSYHVLAKDSRSGDLFSVTNPPFPSAVNGLTPGSSTTGLVSLAVLNPIQRTPINYQYNLSLQQQVLKNTVIQLAYAGNRASHLLTEIEADTPIPTVCSIALANCPAGVVDGALFYPAGATRRNPAWAGIRWYQDNGKSRYDSLMVSMRHQSPRGFQGQVHYTFSKALDTSSNTSPGESLRSPQSFMNPENRDIEWAPSDFNGKHTLVGNFSLPVPLRTGSKFLGTIVNNWTLNGIVTFSSGLPFTPLLSTNNSRNLTTAGLADRPNLRPGFSNNPTHGVSAGCPGFAAGTPVGRARNWFDPCAFSLPIAGTYGNLGRNTLVGPGLANGDIGLEKNFPIREQRNVAFRVEAFNIMNHANFSLPNTTALAASGAANPSAGVITQTVTSSRQLQFGLRINF